MDAPASRARIAPGSVWSPSGATSAVSIRSSSRRDSASSPRTSRNASMRSAGTAPSSGGTQSRGPPNRASSSRWVSAAARMPSIVPLTSRHPPIPAATITNTTSAHPIAHPAATFGHTFEAIGLPPMWRVPSSAADGPPSPPLPSRGNVTPGLWVRRTARARRDGGSRIPGRAVRQPLSVSRGPRNAPSAGPAASGTDTATATGTGDRRRGQKRYTSDSSPSVTVSATCAARSIWNPSVTAQPTPAV